MTVASLERVREIFASALSGPLDERDSFVRSAAGDDSDLSTDVISLLSAHTQAEGYFEQLSKDVLGPLVAAMTSRDDNDGAVTTGSVAHYEILERIGGGGMGVVYKARDTRLGRTVALKFLPPRHATNPAAHARLIAEARAVSALDHPNIGVIYEISEAEPDKPFISLAWYDGETLKAKVQRGQMPVDDVISIATQLGSALVAAHSAGIIHRDVKPANVIVTPSGTVKLLDFGIAQLMTEGESEQTTAGTVPYMSPEQTGNAKVDARTDLWSLGVVMYELLSGKRPFRAEDDDGLVESIRSDDVTPIISLRPDVPAALANTIERCLRKSPADRYSSAEEFCAALREQTNNPEAYALYLQGRYAWGERTRPGLEQALAYFRGALDRDPSFARAHASMAEAYVNMSNFGYMGTAEALARADVSANRAISLDASLAEAYTTRGFVSASRGAYSDAERDFAKALSVNPSYPWTHQYYALLLLMLGRLKEATAQLRACVELDPLSLPANATLGIVDMMQGRNSEARAQFEHAVTLGPDFTLTLYYLGVVSTIEGKLSDGIALLERAVKLSPEFPGIRAALAYAYRRAGRLEEADAMRREIAERARDERSRINLALGHAVAGETDTAFEMLQDVRWDVPTLIELRANPLLGEFRNDPRYPALLARYGLSV